VSAAPDMAENLRKWPLVTQASNRSDQFTKDARLVNAFAERDPNTGEWVVQKRIGYENEFSLGAGGGTWGQYGWASGGGSFYQTGKLYSLYDNGTALVLFADGIALGSPFGVAPLAASPLAGWIETQQQVAANRLLVGATDNTLFHTDGTTITVDTAALPAGRGSQIIGPVYLDGTIYISDELGQIWGSNIDDPTTWQGTNLIIARSTPGRTTALVKQLTYVIALRESGMEVFYDAGNATGSPLSQIAGATNDYGCAFNGSPQVIDGILLYVTSNKTVSPQVIRVDNLVPSIISTPAVEKLLDAAFSGLGFTYGFSFKHGGHRFYGITSQYINLTLVYDIDQQLWYQWTDADGNYFRGIAMASDGTNHFMQDISSGEVYHFDGDYVFPTDAGVVAPVDIYTPNMDFGTRRGKTLTRMYINADQVPGSQIQISHSDDDYQTWSRPRIRSLANKTPYIDDEGTFTKRAYHFRHARATSFRIRSSGLQMMLGTI